MVWACSSLLPSWVLRCGSFRCVNNDGVANYCIIVVGKHNLLRPHFTPMRREGLPLNYHPTENTTLTKLRQHIVYSS